MKKVLTIVMVFIVLTAGANNLKVFYINQGKIWADGVSLKLNSLISSEARIRWEDDRQLFKVIDIETHKVTVVPAKTLITGKMTTISELLFQKQKLSSRNGIFMNIQDLKTFFNQSIALMNSICIETGVLLDDTHFFFLQFEHNGEIINKKLPFKDHFFYLNDDIYNIDGIPFPPVNISSKLLYYEVDEMRVTTIADSMSILVEPREACTVFLQQYMKENLTSEELIEIAEDYCRILFPDCVFEQDDFVMFCSLIQKDSQSFY